jgi:hypothetical protein
MQHNLIHAVCELTPAALDGFLDDLSALQAVEDVGWRIRRRRPRRGKFIRRDAEMLRRHLAGDSYAVLALDYALSRAGAAKACKRAAAFSVYLGISRQVIQRLG